MEELTTYEFVEASVIKRFLARLIDRFIAALLIFVSVSVFGSNTFDALASLGILIGLSLALVYLFAKDALPFLDGQSLGKKVCSIRVVNFSTGEATTSQYGKTFVREIVQWIPLLNFIDMLTVFGAGGRRLGDQWADTIVVDLY
jgi:uncharacterized RDD family membrane protein YckC